MFLDRGRHISDMLVSLLAGTCRFSTQFSYGSIQ